MSYQFKKIWREGDGLPRTDSTSSLLYTVCETQILTIYTSIYLPSSRRVPNSPEWIHYSTLMIKRLITQPLDCHATLSLCFIVERESTDSNLAEEMKKILHTNTTHTMSCISLIWYRSQLASIQPYCNARLRSLAMQGSNKPFRTFAYSPAVKSLFRSMKALEWGTRILTRELRAACHTAFLWGKKTTWFMCSADILKKHRTNQQRCCF